MGEGEERLQAERSSHPLSAGRGRWMSAGVLPANEAAVGAGQSVPSLKHCDVRWKRLILPPTPDPHLPPSTPVAFTL